ncbi:MAG: type II secretion system protein GspK [Candidatus Theseobacter exili]|nr:type II secretion system protein GspK [Candidatus Theseobacter exili]
MQRRRGATVENGGFVLVASLGFLLIISMILSGIAMKSRFGSEAVRDYSDGIEARVGAVSVVNIAMLYISENRDYGLGIFKPVGSEHAEGKCVIEDENGKFPLNSIWDVKGNVRDDRKTELIQILKDIGGSETDAASLISWVSEMKSDKSGNPVKFKCLGELQSIPGWTLEEKHVQEAISSRKGERLNLNTVSEKVLLAVVNKKKEVAELINIRKTHFFKNWTDFDKFLGDSSKVFKDKGERFTFRSDLFSLKGYCKNRRRTGSVFALVHRNGEKIEKRFWSEKLD